MFIATVRSLEEKLGQAVMGTLFSFRHDGKVELYCNVGDVALDVGPDTVRGEGGGLEQYDGVVSLLLCGPTMGLGGGCFTRAKASSLERRLPKRC